MLRLLAAVQDYVIATDSTALNLNGVKVKEKLLVTTGHARGKLDEGWI